MTLAIAGLLQSGYMRSRAGYRWVGSVTELLLAEEPEQPSSFERRAPVVPERLVRAEEPDRVRLTRFAGMILRVVLLPVVRAVVQSAAVLRARLAETRCEAVILAAGGAPLSWSRSEAMAVAGRAVDASGKQVYPLPPLSFGVDLPCGRMRFELVRPQVCDEQVGPAAPVRMQAEP
ncbi:MAG: hypothetical protein IT303_04170 [Dehalococcoidia bacterium]|nr:hypothetical protein [Dehalococcoidia bacterium]